jgi:putative tricarboxylic transport membrane protein
MPMQPLSPKALLRRDGLAGLMFMGLAILGLWLSRDYPVGTTLRMGTGYVPRLLCWLLLGLGALVLARGLRDTYARPVDLAAARVALRPVVVIPVALIAFALALERFGLAVSIWLLVGLAGLARPGPQWWQVAVAAAVLIVLCWAIFIYGLGLTIPLWPEW